MAFILNVQESALYDGTNASFLFGTWLIGCTILETAPNGTLKVQYNEAADWEYVPVGSYVTRVGDHSWRGVISAEAYARDYIEVNPA